MFGLQLGRLGTTGSRPWSESALWPLGAASSGMWIDGPSYPAACWQDSAGTTALSTVGTVLDSSNPVGLVLDRKGGLVLGTELVPASYVGAVSGSWLIGASEITRNGSVAGQAGLNLSSALSTSITYLVSFSVANLSGDTFGFRLGAAGTPYQVASNGTYTARVAAGGTSPSIVFIPWAGSAGQATITNISVREIPGLHLSQSTSAARPVASARKNLLVGTDTLSTQSVTVIAAQCVLSFTGTGTVTLSGVSTAGPLVGTGAADRVSLTFTPTAGSLTLTVSGSVTLAQLEYRA